MSWVNFVGRDAGLSLTARLEDRSLLAVMMMIWLQALTRGTMIESWLFVTIFLHFALKALNDL